MEDAGKERTIFILLFFLSFLSFVFSTLPTLSLSCGGSPFLLNGARLTVYNWARLKMLEKETKRKEKRAPIFRYFVASLMSVCRPI